MSSDDTPDLQRGMDLALDIQREMDRARNMDRVTASHHYRLIAKVEELGARILFSEKYADKLQQLVVKTENMLEEKILQFENACRRIKKAEDEAILLQEELNKRGDLLYGVQAQLNAFGAIHAKDTNILDLEVNVERLRSELASEVGRVEAGQPQEAIDAVVAQVGSLPP